MRLRRSIGVGVHLTVLLLALLVGAPLGAQDRPAAELEAILESQTGAERARTLLRLVDAYKVDDPARAIAFGTEALQLLADGEDPGTRIGVLNETSWAFMTLGQYDSAGVYSDAAEELATRVDDLRGLSRSLSNRGSLEQRRGDPERAVELFSRALAVQRELGDSVQVANSLNNIGFVHSTDLADYSRALAEHLESLAIRERLGDKLSISLSLNNLGIVYSRLRQYDRAREYFERALELRRELGARSREAATLSNLGDLDLDMDDLPAALEHHRQSLAIRATVGDPQALSLGHRSVGLIHSRMGRLDSARVQLTEALRVGEPTGDRGLAVGNLLALAEVERVAGRASAGERLSRRALDLASEMGSRELVRRSWEEVASSQEAAGRYRAALASYRAFKAVSDSIFDEATGRTVAGLERRYDEERRRHEAEQLRSEAAMYELAASRRAVQRDSIAVVALLLGALGLVAYRRRADRIALAEELSMTDALTSARNRRYLQQMLPLDMATSLRRHRAAAERGVAPREADLGIFLLDLDHFKRVNDDHGHAAGDRLLAELVAALRKVCRESDIVVRWGGEEFLVVSRFMEREQAPVVAERLRTAVEAHVTRLDNGGTVGVTCSMGYAVYPFVPERPELLGWEEVVSLADQGAYTSKRCGRNAWTGYVHGEGETPTDILHASPSEVDRWIATGVLRKQTMAGTHDPELVAPVA